MYSFITEFRKESEIHAEDHAEDMQKLLQFDDVEKREPNLETSI